MSKGNERLSCQWQPFMWSCSDWRLLWRFVKYIYSTVQMLKLDVPESRSVWSVRISYTPMGDPGNHQVNPFHSGETPSDLAMNCCDLTPGQHQSNLHRRVFFLPMGASVGDPWKHSEAFGSIVTMNCSSRFAINHLFMKYHHDCHQRFAINQSTINH